MVKKPFRGDYLTFEVRVSYDEKTDTVHLTSKDKDIPTINGFNLALNGGRDAEYALRTLLEERGMIPEDRFKTIASHSFYGNSQRHHVWDEFPLGVHANEEEAVWDSSTSNNVLIIGPTGSGKSVIQRNIIFHCIQNNDQWRFLGVDLTQIELTPYKKYAPAVMEVATNFEDAVEVFRFAREEMMNRYKEMEEFRINNFRDMSNPPKSLMVMVSNMEMFLVQARLDDEARVENELKSEALYLINEIAKLGRAAGVHLVLAAQRFDRSVLNNELVENCTTRIAAGRLSEDQSKALLGNDKATILNAAIRGRGYLQTYGKGADFQGYFAPQDYLDDPRC
jgi:S-DNA-T family DNA segregation ATPase FtsK/SpoIIIE